MLRFLKSLIMALIMTLSLGCTTTWAAEDHYYLRVSGLSTNIGGDFTGKDGYQLKEDTTIKCLIPEFESGNGFGFTLGGYRGRLGGEISYYRTTHDAKFSGFALDESTYQKINLDVRVYVFEFEQARFNIYGLVGLGLPRIKADNLFFKVVTNEDDSLSMTPLGSATFKGKAVNLGAGVIFKINSKLAIDGSYVYSRMDITRMDGNGMKLKPDDSFKADDKVLNLSISYLF